MAHRQARNPVSAMRRRANFGPHSADEFPNPGACRLTHTVWQLDLERDGQNGLFGEKIAPIVTIKEVGKENSHAIRHGAKSYRSRPETMGGVPFSPTAPNHAVAGQAPSRICARRRSETGR